VIEVACRYLDGYGFVVFYGADQIYHIISVLLVDATVEKKMFRCFSLCSQKWEMLKYRI